MEFVLFVIEFIEVETDRNQENLQFNPLLTFPHQPFVPSVIFHYTESALGLYRSVHSEKCTVNAFEVVQHLLVHGGKLMVQADGSVFVAFFCIVLRKGSRCNPHNDRFPPACRTCSSLPAFCRRKSFFCRSDNVSFLPHQF